jgi:hypothetical protein
LQYKNEILENGRILSYYNTKEYDKVYLNEKYFGSFKILVINLTGFSFIMDITSEDSIKTIF